jgi:hypothetical protein
MEPMRKLLTTLAGILLLSVAVGCHEGHLCGYCDCDPGDDKCGYYYGPGAPSNYHPLGYGAPGARPVGEPVAAPKEVTPTEK